MRVVLAVLVLMPLAGCLDVPEEATVPDIVFEVEPELGRWVVLVMAVNGTYDWGDFEVVGCDRLTGPVSKGDMLDGCVQEGTISIWHVPTDTRLLHHVIEGPDLRDPVTWIIDMAGNQYIDGSITIQVGDTVLWRHVDGFTPHDVRSKDDATEEFDSGDMYQTFPGYPNQWAYTFEEVGENPYYCTYHASSMDEVITVLARFDDTP